jgi:hypothetical protein
MPGNPRPAFPKGRAPCKEFGAPVLGSSWLVVDGVKMLAGKPLVGAESG